MADNTQWNGRNILNGAAGGSAGASTVAFQVGMDPTQTISLSFGNMTDGASGVMSQLGASGILSTATVASAIAQASSVLVWSDAAIEKISRSDFWGCVQPMEHAFDNLTNAKTQSALP